MCTPTYKGIHTYIPTPWMWGSHHMWGVPTATTSPKTWCEVFQQLQHLQRHGVSSDPQHHTHTPYPSPHPVHIVYVHSGGGCSGWVCGWCPCLWWGNLNISILEISKMMTSLWIISWYVLCRGVQDDAHHASYAYTISLSSPFTHSVYVVCGDLCREVKTVSRMLGHPEVGDL